MPLVAAENLAKSYGRVKAVDGLSLSLDDSSVTGLIGPNGAGKTTTIKMILGLLKPDRGQVRVFGEDPWNNSSIRSRVGVVYEKAFFPSHYKTLARALSKQLIMTNQLKTISMHDLLFYWTPDDGQHLGLLVCLMALRTADIDVARRSDHLQFSLAELLPKSIEPFGT